MPRVLIVEDDATASEMLTALLKEKSWEVTAAKDGEDGLALIEKMDFDLAVVDTILPGIDGFEVCRRIKEGEKPFKVVVTTGKVDAVDAGKAHRAGADDYCVKTSDFSCLMKSVTDLLTKS